MMASLSKNRDIRKTPPQIDIAEDLFTPGIPISTHQCMVTTTVAPIDGKSANNATEI